MTTVRCVLGIRGMGKTTVAKAIAAPSRAMLAYDPFGEHAALPLDYDDAVEYLDQYAGQQPFRVSLCDVDADTLCSLAWIVGGRVAERGGELLLVVEEADLIAPPGREPSRFRRLVAQGRHRNISIMTTTRRPAEVSRLLTSQAGEFFVFRVQEPADLTYLRSVLGDEALEAQSLAPYRYLRWRPGQPIERGETRVSRIHTRYSDVDTDGTRSSDRVSVETDPPDPGQ